MSTVSNKDAKKWINSSVAIICICFAYVLISFFSQMGEWFELESKVSFWLALHQGLAVAIALFTFIYVTKKQSSSQYLVDVYNEMCKVVFPDKPETSRNTVQIIILVTIAGSILWLFDLIATYLLSLVQNV